MDNHTPNPAVANLSIFPQDRADLYLEELNQDFEKHVPLSMTNQEALVMGVRVRDIIQDAREKPENLLENLDRQKMNDLKVAGNYLEMAGLNFALTRMGINARSRELVELARGDLGLNSGDIAVKVKNNETLSEYIDRQIIYIQGLRENIATVTEEPTERFSQLIDQLSPPSPPARQESAGNRARNRAAIIGGGILYNLRHNRRVQAVTALVGAVAVTGALVVTSASEKVETLGRPPPAQIGPNPASAKPDPLKKGAENKKKPEVKFKKVWRDNVAPGEGITHTIIDFAQSRGENVSPREAYKIYKQAKVRNLIGSKHISNISPQSVQGGYGFVGPGKTQLSAELQEFLYRKFHNK